MGGEVRVGGWCEVVRVTQGRVNVSVRFRVGVGVGVGVGVEGVGFPHDGQHSHDRHSHYRDTGHGTNMSMPRLTLVGAEKFTHGGGGVCMVESMCTHGVGMVESICTHGVGMVESMVAKSGRGGERTHEPSRSKVSSRWMSFTSVANTLMSIVWWSVYRSTTMFA